MNEGIISKRYARALLQYAVGQKAEDSIFSDMKKLANTFADEPMLRIAMDNPTLSKGDKYKIITTVTGNGISPALENFIKLVIDNKRDAYLRLIALSYMDLYCKSKNINTAKLITATAIDSSMVDKIKKLSQSLKPGDLDFETSIDPSIEGGFILYIDTYRLDASVKSQLNKIRKDLITENSKIS